jgi:hypothetical protein
VKKVRNAVLAERAAVGLEIASLPIFQNPARAAGGSVRADDKRDTSVSLKNALRPHRRSKEK